MKEIETLMEEARIIIAKELESCRHNENYDTKEGKQLRALFMSNCIEDMNDSFIPSVFNVNTNSITECL